MIVSTNFADHLSDLINDNKQTKWTGSRFERFYNLTNTEKGDCIEKVISRIFSQAGYLVADRKVRTGDYDIRVTGFNIEVKAASEDIHGLHQFNHIRRDRDYDYLLLIGIAPSRICYQCYHKKDVLSGNAGTLTPMGKNQLDGYKGTYKISKHPRDLIEWNNNSIDDIHRFIILKSQE